MNKKKILVLFFILSILLLLTISCYRHSDIDSNCDNIDIRGLTLKISLITSAYDVYRSNFENATEFNKELYKNGGEYGLQYYEWLKYTYSTMDSKMKKRLINIFDNYGSWSYVEETISLDDNASVKEIVEKINNKSTLELNEILKEDIDIFFNYFYKEYLSTFMKEISPNIEKNVKSMNSYLVKENVDIFKFMEENSGVKFKKDYKAVFYYDLQPIGALGFTYNNYKISTIHINTTKDNLLSTPFHEYSHELFSSFTISNEFKMLTDELKNNKDLYDSYEKIGQYSYDWIGWCEENLVEGFSKYLEYKFYDHKWKDATYVYDLKFLNYLIENKFNPEDIELKDISIEFYKNILEENI